jgi:hypothetical protein
VENVHLKEKVNHLINILPLTELDFVVDILKDAASIKEHVKGRAL